MNERLYLATKKLKLPIKHVAEVGVYYPETSNILGFIKEGLRADLFEADPLCVDRIKTYFKDFGNVLVYPYAIYHESAEVAL